MPNKPVYVTRREFYTGLGTTLNMVGIVALQTVKPQESILREIAALVIALGAIISGLMYIVMALREKKPAREIPDAESSPSPRGPD